MIVALGVLYEYLREIQKGVDRRIAEALRGAGKEIGSGRRSGSSSPVSEVEDAGLLSGRRALRKSGAGYVF